MDKVFASWLERQNTEGVALAAASDVLSLFAEPGVRLPQRFVAEFGCPTMVRDGSAVVRQGGFTVLFQFPDDYLRSAPEVSRLVNLLEPSNAFHPNVAAPFICVGHVIPGTSLIELIYRVHELFTFQRMTPRDDDALNADACAWARRNMHLLPLSTAPLRRQAAAFSVEEIPPLEARHEIRGN
jgi:hypothetical protein